MILSFHPIIEAEQNIICAGREPSPEDLAAIQKADAVILPQGCPEALYRMARSNGPNIFPNMDVRYDYPGKIGQTRLFQKFGVNHPATQCFESVAEFHKSRLKVEFPTVIKMNWGGQGETVFKVSNANELARVIEKITAHENSGQTGFLIQQFIPTGHRSLRAVLIHTHTAFYWRIQPAEITFGTSIAQGAQIDHEVTADIKTAAQQVVENFHQNTGLQLGGFDFIFNTRTLDAGKLEPLMLEINYFFGRDGLGGSEGYYRLFEEQVDKWLGELCLKR